MQLIHLFGDSISRGWGLGVFSDTISAVHPLYSFASISRTANIILNENDAPMRFAFSGAAQLSDITQAINGGRVRAGDWVVLEDAGDHSQNPDEYQELWEVILAALSGAGVRVLMMDMFDYAPAPTNSQYGTVFTSPAGVPRTMNQATAAAASTYSSLVTLLPMRAHMDAFKQYCYGQTLTLAMHADGIHPTIWGQNLMCGEIMLATGARQYIRTLATPAAIVATQWGSMAFGAPSQYWVNPSFALDFLTKSLLPTA